MNLTYESIPPGPTPTPPTWTGPLLAAIRSSSEPPTEVVLTAAQKAEWDAYVLAVKGHPAQIEALRPLLRGAWPIGVSTWTGFLTRAGRVEVGTPAKADITPTKQAFTPFWWECGWCWGPVRNLEEWREMVDAVAQGLTIAEDRAAFRPALMLDSGKVSAREERDGLISIGTKAEHRNGQPFREWAHEHGMEGLLADVGPVIVDDAGTVREQLPLSTGDVVVVEDTEEGSWVDIGPGPDFRTAVLPKTSDTPPTDAEWAAAHEAQHGRPELPVPTAVLTEARGRAPLVADPETAATTKPSRRKR